MTRAFSQPRLRIFAGPNGSGKSTIQHLLHPRWIGAYVNADDIERNLRDRTGPRLSEYGVDGGTLPEVRSRLRQHLATSFLLRQHGFAGVADQLTVADDSTVRIPPEIVNSYVAAVLADAIRHELLAQGTTFTFETVMSSPDKIGFMQNARAQGYRTYLYFVATNDPAINVERVRLRVLQGGHDVPEDKVRSRYRRSIGLLDEACNATNRAYIFDNSAEAHRLIAEVTNGDELKMHTTQIPAWFVGSTLWQSFN